MSLDNPKQVSHCPYCSRSFVRKDLYSRHMERHANLAGQPYGLGRNFMRPPNQRIHSLLPGPYWSHTDDNSQSATSKSQTYTSSLEYIPTTYAINNPDVDFITSSFRNIRLCSPNATPYPSPRMLPTLDRGAQSSFQAPYFHHHPIVYFTSRSMAMNNIINSLSQLGLSADRTQQVLNSVKAYLNDIQEQGLNTEQVQS
jgi:hypothetical protein